MTDENKNVEFLIQINYKSGIQLTSWFSEFTVSLAHDGSIHTVSWKTADPSERILYIGRSNIESIIKCDHRLKGA